MTQTVLSMEQVRCIYDHLAALSSAVHGCAEEGLLYDLPHCFGHSLNKEAVVILEFAYWQSVIAGLVKPKIEMIPYAPARREVPPRGLQVNSAWKGIETILPELIEKFGVEHNRCLEFGVEYGFSTVALSSYFESVTGVDIFCGDQHTVNKSDIYTETVARLAPYPNIHLVRSDYRDFIRDSEETYDLIHVDIVHTFADTYACGLWSARHSTCTIFHDTLSFPQVQQAVREIARTTGKKFYNFDESYGLGILV